MKVKDGFVVREIAGNVLVVPTGNLVGKYTLMEINKSAEFVWHLLENEITEKEIIEKLVQEYEISEETAKTDLESFLEFLREKNVLVEE